MFKNSTQFSLEMNLEYGKSIHIKSIIISDLIIFLIVLFIGLSNFKSDRFFAVTLWVCSGIALIILPFILKSVFKESIKKIMQKNPLQSESIINNFTFSEDELLSISTKDEKEISSLVIKYTDIVRVVENKDNLYFFIGNAQAFLLNAGGMTQGSFDELKEFLKVKFMHGKYFIRKGIFHKKLK